jgi:hypothetical protein
LTLDEARKHASGILPGVTPWPEDHAPEKAWSREADALFPVPELVLFVFRYLLDVEPYGPWEKMRWGVAFLFRGRAFAFELRKFGLTLVHEAGPEEEVRTFTRDLLDRTHRAVQMAENVLEAVAQDEARQGAVAVANLYRKLHDAYVFFRRKARDSFRAPTPGPKRDRRGREYWPFMENEREGGYYASGMMDAYFSNLEHLAVIAFAFSERDASDGRLLDFLGLSLSDKLKELLSPHEDPVARRELERLRELRETWRNPLAHGGIEKGVGSLFFHIPGVGTVPARLTGVKNSIHFHPIVPLAQETFERVCRAFDHFDLFLSRRSPWRPALAWARTGLNVAFDPKYRARYRAASADRTVLREFIRVMCRIADDHTNMDY